MKTKQTVNLAQCSNPAYCSPELRPKEGPLPTKGFDEDEHLYKVLSLKNTMTPKVGSVIRPKEVERLISEGVDVNISPLK